MSLYKRDAFPRGIISYPDWKKAKKGQRVRHVRTLRTGTVVAITSNYMTIDWDDAGFGVSRGRVNSPAFDLQKLTV